MVAGIQKGKNFSNALCRVQNLLKITLSVIVYKKVNIFNFWQNSRWQPEFGKLKKFSEALHLGFITPRGSRICSKIALSLMVFKIIGIFKLQQI